MTRLYSGPESQKLDNLKSGPDRSLRRRSENLIAISLPVTKSNKIVCTHYVKVFCILCLCIILFDTSKASENLTFILKQSLILSSFCVGIIICCLGAMKIEGSIEEMISNLFQNCDVYFEDVKYVNCDPEPVLSGNRRSRYEQFHSIQSNCARKNRRCPRRSREPIRVPLKELTRLFKKSKKLRRLTRMFQRISRSLQKCMIIPVLMCFTM